MVDVAIVGAGMAGLMAARRLITAGREVAVFDRSRLAGGRMATRRVGDAVFDYGAQYFTAREPVFRGWVEGWLRDGLVSAWSDGFTAGDGTRKEDGEPRYMGPRGMATIPQKLAEGVAFHGGATAEACSRSDGRWLIRFKERPPLAARVLLLATPVPQALALLAAGGVVLDPAAAVALTGIEYSPCLAALVRLVGPSRVPPPGGLWLDGEPLGWMADNTRKGISEARLGASVTLHAGPQFSRDHWDTDPAELGRRLTDAAGEWLGAEVTGVRVHRWRYSAPLVIHPARHLVALSPGPVVFAGDAFGGPRVEGAALSGLSAGEAIAGLG